MESAEYAEVGPPPLPTHQGSPRADRESPWESSEWESSEEEKDRHSWSFSSSPPRENTAGWGAEGGGDFAGDLDSSFTATGWLDRSLDTSSTAGSDSAASWQPPPERGYTTGSDAAASWRDARAQDERDWRSDSDDRTSETASAMYDSESESSSDSRSDYSDSGDDSVSWSSSGSGTNASGWSDSGEFGSGGGGEDVDPWPDSEAVWSDSREYTDYGGTASSKLLAKPMGAAAFMPSANREAAATSTADAVPPGRPVASNRQDSHWSQDSREVIQHITNISLGPVTKNSRKQIWEMAEHLLNDDEMEFAPRPHRLSSVPASVPAVFRENGLQRRTATLGADLDKWTNSGGKKGSSEWPVGEEGPPRIRCQYGRILRVREVNLRYQMYTFIDAPPRSGLDRQSRRLFVISAAQRLDETAQAAKTVTRVPDEAPGQKPPEVLAREWKAQVDSIIASLESQASSADGTECELNREDVYTLLKLFEDMSEAPGSAAHAYERPPVLYLTQHRCVYG